MSPLKDLLAGQGQVIVVVEGVGSRGYTPLRRGGRVVECGGLENRYVGSPGVGGSNPPLSALASRYQARREIGAARAQVYDERS